ncbi:hypothetical protein O0L34_g11 [Tuta absoluta]|nr:hypothetical protein O0L34_g11 [Tuta absoluta]
MGVKKKRPYVHFAALSFLASNPADGRKRRSAPGWTDEESNDHDTQRVYASAIPRKTFADPLNSPAKSGKAANDEDVCFTDMLLPMLRKLDDDQKHFAKVEILNVLNMAKRYVPESDHEKKYSTFANNLE